MENWRGVDVFLSRHEVDEGSVQRGRTEDHMINLVEKYRRVRDLFEVRPPRCSTELWRNVLLTWALYLQYGELNRVGVVLRQYDSTTMRLIVYGRRIIGRRYRRARRAALEGRSATMGDSGEELVGPEEGARILGLRGPAGKRRARRLLQKGLIEGAINVSAGLIRAHWMAPRASWEAFRRLRSASNEPDSGVEAPQLVQAR